MRIFITLLLLAAAGGVRAESQVLKYHSGMLRRQYVDSSRSNWEKSGPRPLSTAIFYPVADTIAESTVTIGPAEHPLFMTGVVARKARLAAAPERFPLVIVSHGTGGSGWQMGWLGTELARRGFIVAAVDHHGNTGAEEHYDPRGFVLWCDRTRDLHAVLDRLLADTLFGPRIDRDHIGAAGFSLGGYTVTALAGGRTDLQFFDRFCASSARDATCGAQPEFPEARAMAEELGKKDPAIAGSRSHAGDDFRDPRVSAVVAMAPAVVQAFDPASLRTITVPMLVIVGTADQTAPSRTNAAVLARTVPNTPLVEFPGVVHYDFLSECTADGQARLPVLCREQPGVDRARVHRDVAEQVYRFLSERWSIRR
jgi:predicted dienelactone hydrolase